MKTSPVLNERFKVGSVVELTRGAGALRSWQGRLVLREMLGPGIVRSIDRPGEVQVYWPNAELDVWFDSDDLEQTDLNTHLIVIYRYNQGEHLSKPVCRLVTKAGLSHNWTVELFPDNVIRTIRSDNLAWTFDWNPILERVEPRGTILRDPLAEDDHAEALTVAELAERGEHIELAHPEPAQQ
jgi:hypothetical protein